MILVFFSLFCFFGTQGADGADLMFPSTGGALLWRDGSIWSSGTEPMPGEDVNIDLSKTADAFNCVNAEAFYVHIDRGTNLIGTLSVSSNSRCRVVLSVSGTLNVGRANFIQNSALILHGGVVNNRALLDVNNSYLFGTGSILGDVRMGERSELVPGITLLGLSSECVKCMPGLLDTGGSALFPPSTGHAFGTIQFAAMLEIVEFTRIWIKSGWPISDMPNRPESLPTDQIIANTFLVNGRREETQILMPPINFPAPSNSSSIPFLKWNLLISLSLLEIYAGEPLANIKLIRDCSCIYCCVDLPDPCRCIDAGFNLGNPNCATVSSGGGLGVLLGAADCPQLPTCTPTSCENGGICGQFGCSCQAGFEGNMCDRSTVIIPNGTTTPIPDSGVDARTLGLAIGIPLAVLLGCAIAVGIYLYHRASVAKFTDRANAEIRLKGLSD